MENTFVQSNAPYLRRKKTTFQIMIDLGISLVFIWALAVIMSFVKLGVNYGIKSILLMVVSLVTTLLCDVITTILKNKKDKELGKKIIHDMIHNYSWITALIFTLCCPVWISYYAIICGSIFATMIGKNVFGGFGKNIFNPAAAGRLFVLLCFPSATPSIPGIDASTGATIAGALQSGQNWLGSNPIPGLGVKELLLGTYFGAMGEVFTLALIVVCIFLALREVINIRIPLFYLGTITLSSLFIALLCGFNNPGLYIIYHLCAGGAMFGAVFMLTDPVTTPTSPFGNCLIGVIAGLLTVLIRVGTNNPEGVVYSIMVVNMVSPLIDHFITAKTTKNTLLKSCVTFGSVLVSVIVCTSVGFVRNGGKEFNGIDGLNPEQYEKYAAPLNLSALENKSYYVSKTEIEVEDDALVETTYYILEDGNVSLTKPSSSNYEETSYKKALLIKNKVGKEVGKLYTVKVTQEIDNGYVKIPSTCIAYVAIENKTNNILAVGGYQVAKTIDTKGVGDSCANTALDALAKIDFKNMTKDEFLALKAGEDVSTGASYSFKGFQKAVEKAFEIHSKVQGGN